MKKRTFLALSSAVVTGPVWAPLLNWQQGKKLSNWAGNYYYSTDNLHQPQSVEEVQSLVKKLDKLKVLGTRHCFNSIADSTHNLVSLKNLNQVVALDPAARKVTVEAGVNYGQLSQYLQGKGFALHNLASLPHISVAGGCATATHGSGDKNGNLATAVSAMELVTADGEILKLSREQNRDQFDAAVVHLGGLGVVTKLTLDIQPTFLVRQDVYEHLPLTALESNLEAIFSSGYSVSLFTDWQGPRFNQVWMKRRQPEGQTLETPPEFYGAKLATRKLHPIAELSAENCTDQLGIPGPWYERLPHFRMNFTPSSGKELQSEYFVPRSSAVPALMAISKLSKQLAPQLLISEVRSIAADSLWMSPCYHQDSLTIHFTWKQNWPEVQKLLPVIESSLAPFRAKPHWGKLFTMSPSHLQSLYEKLPAFQQMLKQYDPTGKFRNQFLNTNLYQT